MMKSGQGTGDRRRRSAPDTHPAQRRRGARSTQHAALGTQHSRRAVLGAVAGAMAALLAACAGPEGDTTFRPARTPTTAGGKGVGPLAPALALPVGTIVGAPPKGAPVPELQRMLALIPGGQDPPGGLATFRDRWQGTLTFANLGAVKRLYGYEEIRSFADLAARNVPLTDFTNATAGCYVTDFVGAQYAEGPYRDAFGFDLFQVEREISAGQPPDAFSRMEGVFDADAVNAKLRSGGYTAADYNGAAYSTIRGDSEIGTLTDPRARLALARMNRIAVNGERIIAAPRTTLLAGALDAEARRGVTLDQSQTLRALAAVLGDVTSMATLPPGTVDAVGAVRQPEQLAADTRGWGMLRVPELAAMGYTDRGNFQRTMHVALVYANPADAAADAPELVKRLTGYRSLRRRQPLLPIFATAVTSRTATAFTKGVLIADVALLPEPTQGRLWLDLLFSRDTLFLMPQPLAASGTMTTPNATSGAGSDTPAGTPRP